MTNVDAPFGFAPLNHPTGDLRLRQYPIVSGQTTSIFPGDPVKLITGGTLARAAAGERIIGIFMGAEYTNTEGRPTFGYWPSATVTADAVGLVVDATDAQFKVQADGALTAANVGNLANHIFTHAGSTAYQKSKAELNASDAGTDAGNWRILGLYADPNNAWGTNAVVVVTPYLHEYSVDEPSTPGV